MIPRVLLKGMMLDHLIMELEWFNPNIEEVLAEIVVLLEKLLMRAEVLPMIAEWIDQVQVVELDKKFHMESKIKEMDIEPLSKLNNMGIQDIDQLEV